MKQYVGIYQTKPNQIIGQRKILTKPNKIIGQRKNMSGFTKPNQTK